MATSTVFEAEAASHRQPQQPARNTMFDDAKPIEVVTSPIAKITFPNATSEILQAADLYRSLTIAGLNDKAGFDAVHDARIVVRNARIGVEATRKCLKAESLAYGRAVDAEAKRLTSLLEPIEADLETKEAVVTAEKARLKKLEDDAKREAERLVQVAIDEMIHRRTMQMVECSCPMPSDLRTLTDDQFSEFLRPHQESHAERKRVIAEEAAALVERHRLEREQLAIEAEKARQRSIELEIERQAAAESLKAERERYEAERRIEQAKADAERADFERQQAEFRATIAAAEAERVAAQKVIDDAKAEADRVEREAAEAERQRQLQPEREKLVVLSDEWDRMLVPDGLSEATAAAVNQIIFNAVAAIRQLARSL